jgi:hypothetical protein
MRRLKAEIDQYFQTIRPGITETARVPIGKRRPTFIPSVDATLVGQPSFADGINWAHSWVDHWMTKEDRISWPVDFMEGGRYLVTLHYVCDSKNVSVTANVGGESVTSKLRRHKSKSKTRPDLDSNSDPRRMQSFHAQPMGIVIVDGGHTTIELSRSDTDGAMIELGGVTITNADLPSKQDFHLFLLAGQSNMAGRGKVTAADRYPDPNVLMLDRNAQWVPATDPVHFDKSVAGVGLGRGFARAYASRHPGVTVGLVPCAVGGSPIDSWKPGGYHEQTQSSPYDDALPRIQTAMQNGTFKGILWHQGESDSTPGRAQKYKASLAEVLSRFREQFGEQTPILIGGLAQREVPAWTDARKRVDRSHRELARELPVCAFVESTGLTLKGDNIHFDRDSLLEFGRRYDEALMGIVESKSK